MADFWSPLSYLAQPNRMRVAAGGAGGLDPRSSCSVGTVVADKKIGDKKKKIKIGETKKPLNLIPRTGCGLLCNHRNLGGVHPNLALR